MTNAQQARGTGTQEQVVVVGAGPAGLACAAELQHRGTEPLVLERAGGVAGAWRGRYRALRLNSGRPFSTLPGHRYAPATPMFPGRDDVVAYLEGYAARHRLRVRTGTPVSRVDPAPGGWALHCADGVVTAAQVVIATGLLAAPYLPDPLRGSQGAPLVHSADYVDAVPYRGRDVLVVGSGCSAMEIAYDLATGGARRVLLSVRTPPNLLPRSLAGLPGDPGILLMLRLPPRVADAQLRVLRLLAFGDLAHVGLPVPDEGPLTRLRRDGAAPAVVDPEVVEAVRDGRIRVVPGMRRRTGDGVELVDGSTVSVAAVVAATGFRSGLGPLVGHLRVLNARGLPVAFDEQPALPGLRFLNFGMVPGLLRVAGPRARRTAAAVALDLEGSNGPRLRLRSDRAVTSAAF